jgi:hypothetical protein
MDPGPPMPADMPKGPLTLKVLDRPFLTELGNRFGAKLEANGIQCKIEKIGSPTDIDRSDPSRVAMFLFRLKPTTAQAEDLLAVFRPQNEFNFFYNSDNNPELALRFQQYFDDIDHCEPDESIGLYKAVDRFAVRQVLVRPLYYSGSAKLWRWKDLVMARPTIMGQFSIRIDRFHIR